ncbi:lipid transferase CIDEC-like isoform X1 [Apteryx mantelli]|uniref:Lipid transferase CIDEC-like isoform X1 n=1 Tax=Apteryx mantelli TaxID=2696672 RepID=A0ABM4F0K4_9AVES
MRLCQRLHDPAAAVEPGAAAPALPRLQLGPQPAQGRHGTEPRRAAVPGEPGAAWLPSGRDVRLAGPPAHHHHPLQVESALLAPGPVSLVLDEDGTAVETEAFFQTLEEGTVLMALSKGQTWCASKTPGYQLSLSHKPRRRIDVACITFDLYKTSPKDLGCLNVKATLYGTYSMSYDLRCYGAKRLMKEALRWTLFTMQATGHVLLGTSCYMQQLLDATEEPKEEHVESAPALQSLLPLPRSLPPLPRRKTLQ